MAKISYEWVNKTKNKKIRKRRIFIYHALDEDNNCNCQICGVEMNIKSETEKGNRIITIDHIHPSSRGGSDTYDNYAIVCVYCNWEKGSLTEDEVSLLRQFKMGYGLSKNELKKVVEGLLHERSCKKK